MSNSCLIIIDMQNGIFKQKNGVFNSDIIINNINKSIHHSSENNIIVIITQHENKTSLQKNSENWEIINSLSLITGEHYILEKKHPSIFKNTDIQTILKNNDISSLYICGLVSNGCVKLACLESLKNEYKTYIITDGHSTFYKNPDKIIKDVNYELKSTGVEHITSLDFVKYSS